MRRPKWLAWLWPAQLAVLIAVALWALVFQLRLPGRLPDEASYRAAAELLSREAKPGDAVLLYPWWTERARLFVPDGVPVVGYLHDEQDDLLRHPRIWLLSQPGLPGSDEPGFLAAFGQGRTQVGQPHAFGNLRLTLYQNGRYRPLGFSGRDALASAQVYLEGPGGERTACPWTGDRFKCPGPPHLYVRTEWHEVFYRPRQCIWMHPPGGPTRLVLEFPDARLGSGGALEAGYIWDTFARRGPGNTTTVVRAEDGSTGQTLAELALAPGTEGVQRAPFAKGGTVPLKVSVQSQGGDARWICMDVYAAEATP